MSAEATAWAWRQDLSQNAKLLLLFLADGTDRYHRGAKEAIEDAPYACGFDKQTMQRHLDTLIEKKLVEVFDGNSYRVHAPPPKHTSFRFEQP